MPGPEWLGAMRKARFLAGLFLIRKKKTAQRGLGSLKPRARGVGEGSETQRPKRPRGAIHPRRGNRTQRVCKASIF